MRFRPEQYDRIIMRLVHGDETPGGSPPNPNMLVPWYLMAGFAYEELDDPFLSDGGWDWVCAELDAKWDVVEHVHKHLIDRDALSSGTASYLIGTLPNIIQIASKQLMGAYHSPDEIRPRVEVEMLPVSDLSDLLGTVAKVAKVERDMADLLGIPESTLEGLL